MFVTVPLNCTSPNEEYQCGSACQTECETLGDECPIQNIRCTDACYCEAGYARDNSGICIPTGKCPPKGVGPVSCTRPNEIFSCGSACQSECRTLGEDCPIVNIQCNNGCYCKAGYARDSSGLCIPIEQCPEDIGGIYCPRQFEEYRCGSACQTECRSLGEECPIVNARCNFACYCIDGYARDNSGICVPASDCPPNGVGPVNCTRINEEYQCGSACQKECRTLGQTCPIVNIRCNDACYCRPGYARDDYGACIPIYYCPSPCDNF